MKKLQEYIVGLMPKYDRLMHFFVGFLMFIFCTILFSDLISLFIVIVIGLFKELIYKYVKKTHFDLVDLIFPYYRQL